MRLRRITELLLCISLLLLSFSVTAFADEEKLTITLEDGSAYQVELADADRADNKLALFTRNYGESTKPFQSKTLEAIIVNGIVAEINTKGTYGTYIPANGYVLSGSGAAKSIVEKLKIGQSVSSNQAIPNSPGSDFLFHGGKTGYDVLNPKTKKDNPNGWDDTYNQAYPGLRGVDQLIVYDETYGSETGTNPYGFEVVVNDKGVVVKTGGNNSAIPEGGFVVSGHGAKAQWLMSNVNVGAQCMINKGTKEVVFLFTPESHLESALIGIRSAKEKAAESRSLFLDVPYKRFSS